jgi:alcohol dehydrogenase class IV
MNFEFITAARILFGPGTVQQVPALAAELGRRALLVVGVGDDLYVPVMDGLAAVGVSSVVVPVSHEPTITLVAEGVAFARQEHCDLVIGLGGGSALDTGKAIAILLGNSGNLLDYLDVVGRGLSLSRPGLPVIAIPTTAGTGAEVTRNAVLGVPDQRVKVSLRSAFMSPRAAVVDPQLTYSLPPAITANTGLDALTQVIEPYVSVRNNPLTDALCKEGIYRAARSLRQAYDQGQQAAAREDMSLVSLFGGLALANARLGAVHGFAAPLGGLIPAPHGAVCARLLPFVVGTNIKALRERQPQADALGRYTEVARLLTGDPSAVAEDGVVWLNELCRALNILPLSAYGLMQADFPGLIEHAAKASSMQGNPIQLKPEELMLILEQAI